MDDDMHICVQLFSMFCNVLAFAGLVKLTSTLKSNVRSGGFFFSAVQYVESKSIPVNKLPVWLYASVAHFTMTLSLTTL